MDLNNFQRRFFAELQGFTQIFELLDQLHDLFFFVKDLDSRLVIANAAVLQRLGLANVQQIAGKRDEDFFPAALAESLRKEDLKVFRTGKPIIHRLEAWYDDQHQLSWFLTTRIPLRNRRGKVIGLMGYMRRDLKSHGKSKNVVSSIVEFVLGHANDDLNNCAIAKTFALSDRTLHRKLQTALGITPHELVIRTRIQKAAEALIRTDQPISQIAADFHFCDQSAFTQQFKKRIGMTPLQFRKYHTASSFVSNLTP